MNKVLFLILMIILNLSAKQFTRDELYNNISLDEQDKETKETIKQHVNSAFNLSAHKANYFLPLSYRFQDNFKPTLSHNINNPPTQIEIEFQLSIKYDITKNLLGLNEIISVAYTQQSFWQFYVESAYFRESNYNPEAFMIFPFRVMNTKYGARAFKLGLAHQSNGLGDEYERSWNYYYADLYVQLWYMFVDLKLWYSPTESLHYNPELLDYLGSGHLRLIIPYKKHMLETKFRYSFKGHGSADFDYSYPITGRDDLFLYIKGFYGYGESLIDYDTKLTKISVGFSISR